MSVLERVKYRLDEEVNENILNELINTVNDRLCIRLGIDTLPSLFESICVDATVKMYRRSYYEGISSEGTDGFSTSFVEDILSEYSVEIAEWKDAQINEKGSKRVVTFL